jgi:hypothetical protein
LLLAGLPAHYRWRIRRVGVRRPSDGQGVNAAWWLVVCLAARHPGARR